MNLLKCIEVAPQNKANATVIWLHGLGADGHDFEPIVPELRLPSSMAVRFIFPHSPKIPVTVNGGMVMPAWYDLLSMDIDRKVDQTQLVQSATSIHQLIDREIERGIDSQRIIIAGFSQGGAVAYQAALTYPKPLAALMAMSTYFATKDNIEVHKANAQLPISIMHGSMDGVVPELLGQTACQVLRDKGFLPEYHSYAMQHSVCAEQINTISAFIQKQLG